MKAAIIGAHPMETLGLYDTLSQRFSIIELVYSCDAANPEYAVDMAKKFGLKAASLEEVLADPQIEVILNASFPDVTEQVTEQCLKAGKNIMVYRQIANSFEKGKYLYDLAVKNNVQLSCGVDCIFGAGVQTARYLLDHDAIGKVHSASAVLVRDNHFIGELLPHVLQKGGGILYDLSGYFLMTMFFLFGSVREIQAFGAKGEPVHEVRKVGSEFRGQKIPVTEYEVLSILLKFENDVLVTLHLNSNAIFQKDLFRIAGDYGVLDLGYPHEYNAPVSITTSGMQKCQVPFRFGMSEPVYGVGLADLAWAVHNHRDPRINKEVALHDLEVITGIEKSIQTGEVYKMTTSINRPAPLEEGYYGKDFWTPGEETALAL